MYNVSKGYFIISLPWAGVAVVSMPMKQCYSLYEFHIPCFPAVHHVGRSVCHL